MRHIKLSVLVALSLSLPLLAVHYIRHIEKQVMIGEPMRFEQIIDQPMAYPPPPVEVIITPVPYPEPTEAPRPLPICVRYEGDGNPVDYYGYCYQP